MALDGSEQLQRTNGVQTGPTLWDCGARSPGGRSAPTITMRTIRISRPALRTGVTQRRAERRLWATSPWAGSSTPALPMLSTIPTTRHGGRPRRGSSLRWPFEPLTYASPLEWDVQANPRGTLTITGDIGTITMTNAVGWRDLRFAYLARCDGRAHGHMAGWLVLVERW